MKKKVDSNKLKTILIYCNLLLEVDTTKKNRKLHNVKARCIYYAIANELTELSYAAIGGFIDRDHTTVSHSLKGFDRDIINNDDYLYKYLAIRKISKKIIESDSQFNAEPLIISEKLRLDNIRLLKEIESFKRKTIVESKEDKTMLSIFRLLNEGQKNQAILKISTMHEVGKKLREREPVRKINTV